MAPNCRIPDEFLALEMEVLDTGIGITLRAIQTSFWSKSCSANILGTM